MLTPQDISKMDAITGLKTPTNPQSSISAVANSRVQELHSLASQSQVTPETTPTPESQGATKQTDGTYKAPGIGDALFQTALGVGKAGINTIGGINRAVAGAFTPQVQNFVKSLAPEQFKMFNEIYGQQSADNQAQQGGMDAEHFGEVAIPLADTAANLIESTPKIISKGKSLVQGATEAVGNIVKGKSEEAILATPESQVGELSLKEQKVWYDNADKGIRTQAQSQLSDSKELGNIEKTNIEASHSINKQQVGEDLKTKIATTDKQAADLEKQLSQGANKSVEDLRQPARDLNKQKGQIFDQMRNDAIKGKEGVNVKKIQLSKTIDETVSDPNVAAIVKNQLGITGSGRGGNITLGEIYDKVSSLKETLGNYNPSDYANNQAIKVLNNIMKENGVDFSQANKMWSEWAPVKERIDSTFDIYNKSGLTTGTQANKIISAAKGVDAGNAKFIQTLQDMTGQDLTTDVKNTLGKMDINEKTALANKVDAANKIMESEALKSESLKSQQIQQELREGKIAQDQASKLDALNSKKYEDSRGAWRRAIIKSVLGGGIGIEGIRAMITHHL